MVDQVECLGVVIGLGAAPLSLVGPSAPVELIGSVISLTLLSLLMVAGVVTLVTGVTGNIDHSFNCLKESQEHELASPSKFLCCASA